MLVVTRFAHRVGRNEAGLLAGTAQTRLWGFDNVYRRQRQSRRPKFWQLHGLLVPAYKFGAQSGLSRKAGERIWIGPEIELIVLGIHGGRVKLGFSGPPEVPIHRDELLQRTESDLAPTIAMKEE